MKKQNGITLIALIITIIILLILAGVTINMVIGENGILNNAENSIVKTTLAEEKEKIYLAVSGLQVDKITNGTEIEYNQIKRVLDDEDDKTIIDLKYGTLIKYTKTNNVFFVDKTGFIVCCGVISEIENINMFCIPKVPDGFYYIGGTYTTGIVISDVQNDSMELDGTGNQFVWVPVIADSLSESETKATHFAKWMGYKNDTDNCFGVNGARDEADYNIADYLMCNDAGIPFGIAGENNDAKASIISAGGFWIGRFEASKDENGSAQIKPGVEPWFNTNPIDSMTLSNEFLVPTQASGMVVPGLISGTQWDSTLNWLILTGAITKEEAEIDSGKWGNYDNQKFEYFDTNRTLQIKKSDEYTLILTGSAQNYRNMRNNIWDLAGNLWEWTTEDCSKARAEQPYVARGGGYRYDGSSGAPAAVRASQGSNNNNITRISCSSLCYSE